MLKTKKSRKKSRQVTVTKLPRFLDKINLHAAGIDVGAIEHYVAVPEGCDKDIVRTLMKLMDEQYLKTPYSWNNEP
jgi:hypothetical protein